MIANNNDSNTTNTVMELDPNERIWYYCDSKASQKGPLPTNVMLRLIDKGIIGGDESTMIWREGWPNWISIFEAEPFKKISLFHRKQWYYLDHENTQKGPVFTRFLIHKMKNLEIDGLTLVFTSELENWKKLSEVEELRDEMRKIAEEEERREEMANAYDEQNQVFVSDPLEINPQIYFPPQETAKENNLQAENNDTKYLETDNGSKYRWDDVEQDWVEVDPEDEATFMTQEQGDDDEDIDDDLDDEDNENENESQNTELRKKRKISDQDPVSEKEGEENVNNVNKETEKKPKKRRNKRKKHKGPNTWVYIGGLPENITMEEIKDHFSRVGLISISPVDQQPKIKIYKQPHDSRLCKGDALLCFNAEESVKLAIEYLNGGYIRTNAQISVSLASFDNFNARDELTTEEGGNKPTKRSSTLSSLTQAQIKVAKNAMKQALAWNEDDDCGISRSSALKIIVLEGIFHPHEFIQDPSYEQEIQNDVYQECSKFGPIEKITMFSKNPRGILIVKYGTGYGAQECIRVMNGRYFGGKKIKSYYWDGVSNYSLQSIVSEKEEEKEEEHRLEEFGDWLDQDQDDLPEEFKLRVEQ